LLSFTEQVNCANNDNYPVFNNVANYTNSVITGDKLDGAQVTIGIGTNG
jgi:hypothetical protein